MNDYEATVEIDGVTWREDELGMAADGTPVQLLRYGHNAGRRSERDRWHWAMFDSEYNWHIDDVELGAPPRPIRKMRLVPVEEGS